MNPIESPLFTSIRDVIIASRQRVYRLVNAALLETYWQIGKIIVEGEQQGQAKADYGKATLKKPGTTAHA